MAVKLNSLRSNLKRETEGDWVDIPELPDVRLLVRGFAYGPYQMAKGIVEAKWARQFGRQPVPTDVAHKANGKLYADHILLGWDGFDAPYTEETALEVLTDPEHREMHDHIRYAGQKVMQTEAEFVEDAAKNSPRRSGGSSETA